MSTFYFLLAIFISCVLQGITGFGFAVLAAPLGLLFFDQPTITVALSVIGLVLNGYLVRKIETKINKKIVLHLIISGLIGIPLGVLALTSLDANLLKLIVGILAIIFALLLILPKTRIKEKFPLTFSLGGLTGFLQSSVGLSGPPIVLLLLSYGLKPKELRKILAVVFLVLNIVTLPLLFWKDVLTLQGLFLGLMTIPVVIFGAALGNSISNHISQNLLRWLTLAIIVAAGIHLIIKTLFG